METIKGYKGFDKNMKCRGFQYEENKTYTHTGKVSACHSGFHFCKHPLDVFAHYAPTSNTFSEVVGSGKTNSDDDKKVACEIITVGVKLDLKAYLNLAFKIIFEKVKWGEKDTPQTHGYSSAAQTHGYSSAAQTHGYSSAAQTHGKNSISVSTGCNGKAAGIIGNWITLAEWTDNMEIKTVKAVKVDGKKIKADTWYSLVGGKFVEVE